MSLVNDALKKARMEAARGEAAKRGIPYPALGTGRRPRSSHPWIAALVLTVVVAGIGGFLLYRAGHRAALEQKRISQKVGGAAATSPALDSSAGASAARSVPSEALFEEASAAPAEKTAPSPPTVPMPPEPSSTRPSAEDGSPTASDMPAVSREVEASAGTSTETRRRSRQPAREAPAEAPAKRAEPAPAELASSSRGAAEPAEPGGSAGAASAAETVREAEEQEFVRRAEIPGIGPVELGGIAWSGDRPFALVNGRVVRPGDSILGLVVDEILPNTLRLRGETGTLVFRLK